MNLKRSVSLLIPCYNAARHLPGLAQQIAAQTSVFAEVICYDDKSQDDTATVARALGFDVITGRENRGAAFARNRLLEAASAPWVHFHDADDGLDPRFLERLSSCLGEERTAVMCAVRKRWSGGREPDVVYRHPEAGTHTDWIAFFIRYFVHVNAFIFPRSAILRAGGFAEDLRIAEDREFLVRAAVRGLRFRYVDEALVDWVVHPDSTLGRAETETRWRFDGIFLRRCYDILDAPHRRILGEHALHRGWWLCWNGVIPGARENVAVANLCGVRHEPEAKFVGRIMSRVLGTLPYFVLKKRWASLAAQWRGAVPAGAPEGSETP
ncbi:MAG: glycosyltransferase family 2 protein [Verrucomicrobia bacterium]|nr:glycosyltransferase family 2 protein [Verrucomicrobiota bacterium]